MSTIFEMIGMIIFGLGGLFLFIEIVSRILFEILRHTDSFAAFATYYAKQWRK